jgi:hypothetical protein
VSRMHAQNAPRMGVCEPGLPIRCASRRTTQRGGGKTDAAFYCVMSVTRRTVVYLGPELEIAAGLLYGGTVHGQGATADEAKASAHEACRRLSDYSRRTRR